jgi:hypothetical protein
MVHLVYQVQLAPRVVRVQPALPAKQAPPVPLETRVLLEIRGIQGKLARQVKVAPQVKLDQLGKLVIPVLLDSLVQLDQPVLLELLVTQV